MNETFNMIFFFFFTVFRKRRPKLYINLWWQPVSSGSLDLSTVVFDQLTTRFQCFLWFITYISIYPSNEYNVMNVNVFVHLPSWDKGDIRKNEKKGKEI